MREIDKPMQEMLTLMRKVKHLDPAEAAFVLTATAYTVAGIEGAQAQAGDVADWLKKENPAWFQIAEDNRKKRKAYRNN